MGEGLARFVEAQDADGAYDRAVTELRRGRKTGHWIWFVLPQLVGLGHSATARRYGLQGLDEAAAYAAHPVLGPRLAECARLLLAAETPPEVVLGGLDALKARSSMTLFALADPTEPLWAEVLDGCYDGERDPATLALLAEQERT